MTWAWLCASAPSSCAGRGRCVVLEADRLILPPDRHDAIIEADVRDTATEFTHLEGVGGLVGHIESPAVAVGHGKHPVFLLRVDGLDEIGVELDDSNSAD